MFGKNKINQIRSKEDKIKKQAQGIMYFIAFVSIFLGLLSIKFGSGIITMIVGSLFIVLGVSGFSDTTFERMWEENKSEILKMYEEKEKKKEGK